MNKMIEPGAITLVYGGTSIQRTIFTLNTLLNVALENWKSLYIYSDTPINLLRFTQYEGGENVTIEFLQDPLDLLDQLLVIRNRGANLDVIAIDSLSDLYDNGVADRGLIQSLTTINAIMALLRELVDDKLLSVIVVARTKLNSEIPDPKVLSFWVDKLVNITSLQGRYSSGA